MIQEQHFEIDNEILKIAYKSAWSIESMAEHGAEGRAVTYIGSTRKRDIITDYYEDDAGCYWFKNRGVKNGEIVSMDMYIFGREIKRKNRKRKS